MAGLPNNKYMSLSWLWFAYLSFFPVYFSVAFAQFLLSLLVITTCLNIAVLFKYKFSIQQQYICTLHVNPDSQPLNNTTVRSTSIFSESHLASERRHMPKFVFAVFQL